MDGLSVSNSTKLTAFRKTNVIQLIVKICPSDLVSDMPVNTCHIE